LNLDLIEKQEVDGFLSTHPSDDKQIKVQGYILFDKFNIENSNINFANLPRDVDLMKRNYYYQSGKYLFNLSRISFEIFSREITFQVDRLEYQDENEKQLYHYHSSYVTSLLYEEEEIILPDFKIYKRMIKRNQKNYFYYEVESVHQLSDDVVNNIFYILSFKTASLFFCICSTETNGKVTFVRKYSRNRHLTIFGSGNLMYPIDFEATYNLINSMSNKDFFKNIIFLYSKFCTINDKINQFLNGSNLIEYLATCYIEKHKSEYSNLINGKGSFSQRLYFVLDSILESNEKNYLISLFSSYPQTISQLNTSNNQQQNNAFFFVRLRNNLVHNGKLIEEKDEYTNLLDNIFVINELLRMLISYLDKIEKVEKTINGIQVNSMKQIIENRKQILGS